jgi:hypothetical protein
MVLDAQRLLKKETKYWPPMNADERGLKTKNFWLQISVHQRLSAANNRFFTSPNQENK